MHSAATIFAQTKLESIPKIINPYWDCKTIPNVSLIEFLLNQLNNKHSNQSIVNQSNK